MLQLNFPEYNFRFKKTEKNTLIFDDFRKKWVALNPEEWVRQHFIRYLTEEKKYPASFIAIERKLMVNGTLKRFDALVFDKEGKPQVIIEFKAPEVEIKQKTFDQAAVYNSVLNVDYLFISNGINHYFCKVNRTEGRYIFLENLPEYNELF